MNTKLIYTLLFSLFVHTISFAQTSEKQLTFGEVAAYFDGKRKMMENELSETARQPWDNQFVTRLEELDLPGLTTRIT